MRKLSPEELKSRLQLDFQVCQYMFGTIFTGEAYRTTSDLEKRSNKITSLSEGHLAKKYRVDFHVKTLIGPSKFADLTTIGFDLDVDNYPFGTPITWLISAHVPYSPHFRQGAPVCLGDTSTGIWPSSKGHMLLGQLFVHIARLLNWDEVALDSGYVGWNGEAIAYYKRVYKGRPITEGLQYPVLPPHLYGMDANKPQGTGTLNTLFRPMKPSTTIDSSLFKGKGHQ